VVVVDVVIVVVVVDIVVVVVAVVVVVGKTVTGVDAGVGRIVGLQYLQSSLDIQPSGFSIVLTNPPQCTPSLHSPRLLPPS